MRIVVTGATGNIGSALLRALDGRGHDVPGSRVVRRPTRATSGGPASTWRRPPAFAGCSRWWPEPMQSSTSPGPSSRCAGRTTWSGRRWASSSASPRLCWPHRTRLVHLSSVAAYSPRRSPTLVREEWAREGIPAATYSRLKVRAERALTDVAMAAGARDRVAVVRPALVGQLSAGGMLRCGAPAVLPARALRLVPVDRRFGIQLVHADDVADVVVRVIEEEAAGPFNVAAEPVLSAWDVATALGAKPIRLRQELTRASAAAVWHGHVSPLDPGWVDMALQASWLDSSRARDLLGWAPRHDAHAVLAEVVRGLARGAGRSSAALRSRRVLDGILRSAVRGSVARRRLT